MCLPLAPLASFAISAGTAALQAGASFIAQSQQHSYTSKIAAQNERIIRENASSQFGQLAARRQQERAAAAAEIAQIESEARRSRSFAQVAAGEGGVGGASTLAIYDDFVRQESDFAQNVLLNESFAELQFLEDQKAIQSNAVSRISQARSQVTQSPSIFNLGLSIAGSTLGAFNQFSIQDPDTGVRRLV